MLNHSLLETKQTVYNFTDLQSCYDHQLANIRSVVKESVGRNRSAIKLFTILIPRFKHCVSAGNRVSTNYYGGELEEMAETGQGNKFWETCAEMCHV